jgi:SAM-dependent methyltransferase
MKNPHDERYNQAGYYWGTRPSEICFRVLRLLPPDRPLRLLDIGCGEGRNAVFFARNGYHVTAFDSLPKGVEKAKQIAERAGVKPALRLMHSRPTSTSSGSQKILTFCSQPVLCNTSFRTLDLSYYKIIISSLLLPGSMCFLYLSVNLLSRVLPTLRRQRICGFHERS